MTIDPSAEPSRVVPVPAKLLAAAGKPQRINIDIEGRGTFSYSAVLAGFVPADKLNRRQTHGDGHLSLAPYRLPATGPNAGGGRRWWVADS